MGVATVLQTGGPEVPFDVDGRPLEWRPSMQKGSQSFLVIDLRDDNGLISGGPMYYILSRMGEKWLNHWLSAVASVGSPIWDRNHDSGYPITGSLQASFGTAPEVASVVLC